MTYLTPSVLSSVGLVFDVVGVVIVGFLAEKWLMLCADARRHFANSWQSWVNRAGWALIALGFLLQLAGQFVRP